MLLDLPTGPRGRILAVGLTIVVLLVLWFGFASPILNWYADRADTLARQDMLAHRMADLVASLPSLERAAANLRAGMTDSDALLPGDSDAVAAASLQERVQALARNAGAVLTSVEILPVVQIGQFRRIGLRLAMQGDMSRVIRLLQLLAQSQPRVLVDELEMQRRLLLIQPKAPDVDAKFVAYAFRSGTAAERGTP